MRELRKERIGIRKYMILRYEGELRVYKEIDKIMKVGGNKGGIK